MNLVAGDGLPARPGGPWTRDKLGYLRRYAQAFMTAMAPHRAAGRWSELTYVDLLAGPGLGIDRDGAEFDGSPLIALKMTPPFDRIFLGDLRRRNIRALERRIPARDGPRVWLREGDCNILVHQVIAELGARSLALAFVDPEGFEVHFDPFRALAARRVDVLFLFPSRIGIARNLSAFTRKPDSPMDQLWGSRQWREVAPARLAAGHRLGPDDIADLERPWVSRFRERIARIGFSYQDESDPSLKNEKNVPMYHLLFFSKHATALKIWRAIKKVDPTGQRSLPFP